NVTGVQTCALPIYSYVFNATTAKKSTYNQVPIFKLKEGVCCMQANKPKIVVLGAGYAGMMTTKRLSQKLEPEEADIVLVNKHNYHYQTTWLNEVAASTNNTNQARIMISDVINPNRVRLIYDEVIKVNKEEKRVELANSEISYDYLVISLGFETNTFGIKGMEENAFFIND